MNNKSLKATKPPKSISHYHKNHHIKEQKNLIDIQNPPSHKLKIHKSTRPFGKDITNTFK